MIKRCNVLFLALLFSAALSAADSPDKNAERLNMTGSVRKNLKAIEAVCDRDANRYSGYATIGTSDVRLPEQMEKGLVYFNNGDYAAAADHFYFVVELHQNNDEMRQEALLKLAESLYMRKNYVSAVKYYEMLFTTTEYQDRKAQSLKRIVESNYYLGNYAAAKSFYDKFKNSVSGEPDSELLYYLGKSLFYDKRFHEAVTVFYSVKKESEFYPQSRYFLGMLSIKEHEYDDALSFYEEIVSLKDNGKYRKFKEIRELAAVAAARVEFETGGFDKAVTFYNVADRQSSAFAKARFELAWAYIKSGNYNSAVDSLRIVKFLAPYSAKVPEAEALEGNLLVRENKYGEAMLLFDSMVKKYGRMQDELFWIDGKRFMLSGRPERVSDFLLPYSPVVQSLLRDSRKFTEAMELDEKIAILEEDLARLSSYENMIAAATGSGNSAAVFPELKADARKILLLRDKIAVMKNNLVMMRKTAIEDVMDKDDLRRFNELDLKKRALLRLPDVRIVEPSRIRECAGEYLDRVGRDEAELRKISGELDSMSEELDEIITFNAKEHRLEVKDEQEFVGKLAGEREALRDMMLDSDSCTAELETEKSVLFFGGGLEAVEIAIRDSLNAISDKQYELVKGDMLSEAHRLMGEADRIDRKLAERYDALNRAAQGMVRNARISYEKERNDIDGYRSQLAEIQREAREMAVLAMYSDLNTVKTAVAGYVLQGNLGMADVIWEKKEEDTSEILRLKTLKAKEIQQLYLNLDGEQ